jgi:hypothetical protein
MSNPTPLSQPVNSAHDCRYPLARATTPSALRMSLPSAAPSLPLLELGGTNSKSGHGLIRDRADQQLRPINSLEYSLRRLSPY